MPYGSSSSATLVVVREHVPGFASLRRAASWPGPARRLLVGRWLARRGLAASPDSVVQAVKLLRKDDRAFCRDVRLDGWREAVQEERAVFELQDDGGLRWPVALRALMLFGAAGLGMDTPRRVVLPGGRNETSESTDWPCFTVRTESLRSGPSGDAEFHVIVRRETRPLTQTPSIEIQAPN